jgi:hypothetical protein
LATIFSFDPCIFFLLRRIETSSPPLLHIFCLLGEKIEVSWSLKFEFTRLLPTLDDETKVTTTADDDDDDKIKLLRGISVAVGMII